MDWINKYLTSNHLRQFQAVVDGVPKDKNYRSWIGLNFDGSDLYSVKFYYTWYRPLTKSEIKRLLFFGSSDDYNHDYKKVSLDNVLNVNEAGSGFTFVLKLDINQNPTYGYYFKQVFDKSDLFFNLPETKLFLRRGGNLTDINFVKNQALFYRPNGEKNSKNYYYIQNPLFKSIIANLFKEPLIATAPIIEYAVGDGHRRLSNNELSKKKVVLIGDRGKLAAHYINIWKDIDNYSRGFLDKGFQVLCPGTYADHDARSFYVFDFNGGHQLIEKLIKSN